MPARRRYSAPEGSTKLFIDGDAAWQALDDAHEMKNTDEMAYQARNDAIRQAPIKLTKS